jgi:phenylalanyl-tRNA synthetase beta chain
MKISYRWLSRYLPQIPPVEEIAELLTSSGLEVESIETFETIKGSLKGLVCGKVLTCVQHPNADRLKLTTVDDGSGTQIQVVCGAPNVAAGQHVVLAPVGTTVYPLEGEPFIIKQANIRGELSQGMLCAEDEIGLGKSHEGLLILPDSIAPGQLLAPIFGVEEDLVLEIGLTPNRIDAISHIAIAREIVALYRIRKNIPLDFIEPEMLPAPKENSMPVVIKVEAEDACLRYNATYASGFAGVQTPLWMRNHLLAAGLRPIHLAADICNFVMLETGQPMHAFDAAKIEGNHLFIRMAMENEAFELLDGTICKPDAQDLVIADNKKPLCLAGIMGGREASMQVSSDELVFESACFAPVNIRKSSKRLQVKSDSSFRFERGSDINACEYALMRAITLLSQCAPSCKIQGWFLHYPKLVSPAILQVNPDKIRRITGTLVSNNEMAGILTAGGMPTKEEGENLLVSIPTNKVDVTREADVAEEFLRLYGYDNVVLPGVMKFTPSSLSSPYELRDKLAGYLTGRGFTETMSLSLDAANGWHAKGVEPVPVDNPLSSELGVLRTGMLGGLLKTTAHNMSHKTHDIRIFEFGKTYAKIPEGIGEQHMLGILASGKMNEHHFSVPGRDSGWMDIKALAEVCLQMCGCNPSNLKVSATAHGFVYTGKKEKVFAEIYTISKKQLAGLDIKQSIFAACINLDVCNRYAESAPRFKQVTKFPSVKRDLALVIDHKVEYHTLKRLAFETERKLLKEVSLFDVYKGDKIPEGKKSYALSFVLQDATKTLSDVEIDQCIEKLLKKFEKETGASLRS